MTSLLPRVRARMAIPSSRLSTGILEGGYASVFHGRSTDFDDLRAYAPGDDVRDIDWRASARHIDPLVRRSVAQRRKRLVLVVDTGAGLGALSAGGQQKRDLAVFLAGAMASIAARNGDDTQLFSGTAQDTRISRAGASDRHLESLLRTIHGHQPQPGRIGAQLQSLAEQGGGSRIVLVIADDAGLDPEAARLVPGLARRHELLWGTLADADLAALAWTRTAFTDVVDGHEVEGVIDRGLAAEYHAAEAARSAELERLMRRHGVPHARISSVDDALLQLYRLLRQLGGRGRTGRSA